MLRIIRCNSEDTYSQESALYKYMCLSLYKIIHIFVLHKCWLASPRIDEVLNSEIDVVRNIPDVYYVLEVTFNQRELHLIVRRNLLRGRYRTDVL